MHSSKVLITGASSGLGKELAYTFAKNNHDLLICGTNFNELQELKKQIEFNYKISCTISCGNLLDKNYFNQLILLADTLNVEILINNAAILCAGKTLENLEDDYINNSIDLNFKIPVLLTKNIYKNLKNIIMINSLAGINPKKNRTVYCATKSALKMFSETLLLETNINILNVYISKLKKNNDDFGLDMREVSSMIYRSFKNKQNYLTIDGRNL